MVGEKAWLKAPWESRTVYSIASDSHGDFAELRRKNTPFSGGRHTHTGHMACQARHALDFSHFPPT